MRIAGDSAICDWCPAMRLKPRRGPGNPPGSVWRSTPAELRHRKPINVTVDAATKEQLDDWRERLGVPAGRAIDALVAQASDDDVTVGAGSQKPTEDRSSVGARSGRN